METDVGDELDRLASEFDAEGEAAKLKDAVDECEVEKLTLDEGISDRERILTVLQSENILQKASFLNLLPRYFQENVENTEQVTEMVHLVFQSLQELGDDLVNSQTESKSAVVSEVLSITKPIRISEGKRLAVQFLLDLLSKQTKTVSYGHVNETERCLVDETLDAIEVIMRDENSEEGALQMLMDLIKSVCTEALSCVSYSQKRVLGLHLIGVLSRCGYFSSSSHSIKLSEASTFLALVTPLFQDIDMEVRVVVCRELDAIVAAVCEDTFVQHLLGEFLELIKDEEEQVRLAAIAVAPVLAQRLNNTDEWKQRVLPHILDHLKSEESQRTIQLVNKKSLEPGEDELHHACVLAKALGPLIYSLKDVAKAQLQDEMSPLNELLSLYFNLCTAASAEVRRLCAFNWPAVVLTLGGANYAKHLHGVYERLCKDECTKVRYTVASSLHEVAKVLGKPRMVRYVAPEIFPSLLLDSAPNVRRVLIDHFVEIVNSFAVSEDTARTNVFNTLEKNVFHFLLPSQLLTGRQDLDTDWRFRAKCMDCIVHVHDLFSAANADEYFIPRLQKYMLEACEPLRLAATRVLSWMMSKNVVTASKVHIIHDVKATFCRGHSWSLRKLFVFFCECAAKDFPQAFLQKYRLADAIFDLLEDKVANVRIEVCTRMLTLVSSGLLSVSEAKRALEKIIPLDQDRDVKTLAQLALEELPKLSLSSSVNDKVTAIRVEPAIPKASNPSSSRVGTTNMSSMRHTSSGKSQSRVRPPMGTVGTGPPSPRVRRHLKR